VPNKSFNPTAGVGLVANQTTRAGVGLIQALGAKVEIASVTASPSLRRKYR